MIGNKGGTDPQQPFHLLITRCLRPQTQMNPVLDRLDLRHLVEVQHRPLRQQHLSLGLPRLVRRMLRTPSHPAPEPSQLIGIRTVNRHVLHHRNHAHQLPMTHALDGSRGTLRNRATRVIHPKDDVQGISHAKLSNNRNSHNVHNRSNRAPALQYQSETSQRRTAGRTPEPRPAASLSTARCPSTAPPRRNRRLRGRPVRHRLGHSRPSLHVSSWRATHTQPVQLLAGRAHRPLRGHKQPDLGELLTRLTYRGANRSAHSATRLAPREVKAGETYSNNARREHSPPTCGP